MLKPHVRHVKRDSVGDVEEVRGVPQRRQNIRFVSAPLQKVSNEGRRKKMKHVHLRFSRGSFEIINIVSGQFGIFVGNSNRNSFKMLKMKGIFLTFPFAHLCGVAFILFPHCNNIIMDGLDSHHNYFSLRFSIYQ